VVANYHLEIIKDDSVDMKDPQILIDRNENALIEALNPEQNQIEEQDEKYYELIFKRLDELNKEIDESKTRKNYNAGRGEYNTYMVGDNREGKSGTGRMEVFTK
jgi:hypothetical protein